MALELISANNIPVAPPILNTLAEITALLNLSVRAIVDHRDAVIVNPISESGRKVVFCVHVHSDDMGKVLGKQGRTVTSLRIILGVIAKQRGAKYSLIVNEWALSDREEN